MLSFNQFLLEDLVRGVFKNPSMERVKELARADRGRSLRYIVTADGNLYCAQSYNYNHDDIANHMGLTDSDWNHSVQGYIEYRNGQYVYSMDADAAYVVYQPYVARVFAKMDGSGLRRGITAVG